MTLQTFFRRLWILWGGGYFGQYPIKTIHRKVFGYRDEPSLHIYEATVDDHPRVHATGKSFFSETDAKTAAFCEAIERFSYREFFPENPINAPYKDVKGEHALDIFSLAGFSPEKIRADPRLQFDDNTQLAFIPAKDMRRDAEALIPLQLASPKHFKRATKHGSEPILRLPITTGVAAGRTQEEAQYSGILECIERDAFMITYMNTISPPKIAVRDFSIHIHGQHIVDYFESFQLHIHVMRLLTDFPLNAIAAVIVDESGRGPAVSMGAAAHHDVEAAICKALGEALTSRLYSRSHDLHRMELLPQEPIRQRERKIFWGKRENLEKIRFFISGKDENDRTRSIDRVRHSPHKSPLGAVLNFLKEHQLAAYYVDMTPKWAEDLHLKIGKVIIPQLQPMHLDERYAYTGGERLRSVPRQLGYVAGDLNTVPHLFH
ncbi:MAG: YcaO-like family protein [Patescibacteria group bacterium]